MIDELYTDGGCIGPNPSKLGGTWAWCLVREDVIFRAECGIITPKDIGLPSVTNNYAELFAAYRALYAMGSGWRGILHTDSKVTKSRLTGDSSFNGIPQGLRLKILEIRRNRRWKVIMVGGHPTKSMLKRGKNNKGYPVSKWNVHCDEQCTRLAKEFVLTTTETKR